MRLTRDAILKATSLPTEEVAVPEWGGSVLVGTMTGTERDRFEAEHVKAPTENFRARLAAATVREPLFSLADVETLGKTSADALTRVTEAAYRLNKFGASEREEIAKNSEPAPGEDSSSDSL